MKRTISAICASLILGTTMMSAQNLNLWMTDQGSGVLLNAGTPMYYPTPMIYYNTPVVVDGYHRHPRVHVDKKHNKKVRKQLKKMKKARKKYYKAQREYYRHVYDRRHGHRHHHDDDDDDDD